MNVREQVKSRINLFGVLKNIEKLIEFDDEIKLLTQDWQISIQFRVRKGPVITICFQQGQCTVKKGRFKPVDVIFYFLSDAHLNKMFDGKANPIPLRGWTKLGFMQKQFSRVTDRLAYYLKSDNQLLKDPVYEQINTAFTLTTAIHALSILIKYDQKARLTGSQLTKGLLLIKIEDGPQAFLQTDRNAVEVVERTTQEASCEMVFKNVHIANRFFSGHVDVFSALAKQDIKIAGQTYLLDNIGLILDRIPLYMN